jgi:type IV pilus assembly protein PilN
MRFSINLATRTYIDTRLLNQIFGAFIAVLVVLLGWNISRVATNLGEQQRLAADVVLLEGRLKGKPGDVSEKNFKSQQVSISFYNGIIDRKSTRWLGLLDLVESVTPEGIALSVLTPGKKTGELKLEGRAKSFAAVRRYLEALEESKSFSNVLLLSHQELLFGEKGRGVQFAISCRVQF